MTITELLTRDWFVILNPHGHIWKANRGLFKTREYPQRVLDRGGERLKDFKIIHIRMVEVDPNA